MYFSLNSQKIKKSIFLQNEVQIPINVLLLKQPKRIHLGKKRYKVC